MPWRPKSSSPSLRPANSIHRRCRSGRPTWDGRRRSSCSDIRFLLSDSLRGQAGRQILEAGVGLVEVEVHESGWTVALLADYDFGAPFEGVAVLVRGPVAHLLSEDEHHQIGVLLDRPRFAKVRELRALVLGSALLRSARQLRKRDDRNSQLSRESLERARDVADLLLPALGVGRTLHQLEVVDHDHPNVVFLL